MNKKILLFLLLLIPVFSFSQYGNRIKHRNDNGFVNKKSRPSRHLVLAIGASNFLGELGGANQIGTFFVKDLEFKATRPSLDLGYRYKRNRFWAVECGLHYLVLTGADKLTQEPFRNNRNISFRARVVELSVQGELYFTKDRQGHLYRIKNAKGKKSYDFQGYVFGGVGVFFFNPQAKYLGKWYNLQPLGTEGQGLEGGPKKYSRFNICIPYGIGVSEGIGKLWQIGLEIGIRKTFTDYIDDVSGNYFDNQSIRKEHGDIAAALADPSLADYPTSLAGHGNQTAAGQQRGDPTHKDAYMFTNITFVYKLPNRHRVKSKF